MKWGNYCRYFYFSQGIPNDELGLKYKFVTDRYPLVSVLTTLQGVTEHLVFLSLQISKYILTSADILPADQHAYWHMLEYAHFFLRPNGCMLIGSISPCFR